MRPYNGIIRITCQRKKGCLRNLKRDVQPGCLDCPEALAGILDLEGKVLFEYRSLAQRTGRRKRKS